MGKNFLETIGFQLGQRAAQAKSAFDLMGGTEEDSLRAEIRLGHDLAAAVLERTPLLADGETTRYVGQIAHWLTAYVKERKLPFTVRVTAEAAANAFALPGGPIFVSWPLLQLCEGQRDEIAFVLGHEAGHIVRRHALDRLVKDSALSLLLQQSAGRHLAAGWLNKMGRQVLVAAYSREEELEADAFGANLVCAAGGDGLAAERLLEKLARKNSARGAGPVDEFFATHPPFPERLAQLRARKSK